MTAKIREVTAGIFEVRSFSMLGVVYRVNLEAGTCPAFSHGSRRPCKHLSAVAEYQARKPNERSVRP